MPKVGETQLRTLPVIPATLRTLASDLRNGADLNALIGALGRALAAVPPLRGFTVAPMSGPAEFGPDRLALPVVGSSGPLGLMTVSPGGDGAYRGSRLQLAGALADLAAVVIEHALSARSRLAPAEIVAVALADVPVGVLCFDGAGALVSANPAAQRLLEGRVPVDWPGVWAGLAPESRSTPGMSFVWRQGSRLVHVTARRSGPAGAGAVVLVDHSARIDAFSAVLSAEVYRSLVEKAPLVLGVIAGPAGSPAALEALELGRTSLPDGVRVGPVDGEAVAVLAAAPQAGVLWPLLRDVVRSHPERDSLRGGVAALRAGGDSPGSILSRAIAAMRPLAVDLRPGVLVCDRSPTVNDTLALMLRRDFAVTCSANWGDSLALLEEQTFDGLVLELPPRGDTRAQAFAARALDLQPAAQSFFVTDMPGPWETAELGRPERPVFRKPFVVRDVRAAFKHAFTRP